MSLGEITRSPYTPGEPVEDDKVFKNYNRVIETIKTRLRNPGSSYAVVGGFRMAKTSVLRRIRRDLLKALSEDAMLAPALIPIYMELRPPGGEDPGRLRHLLCGIMRKTLEEVRRIVPPFSFDDASLRITRPSTGEVNGDQADFYCDLRQVIKELALDWRVARIVFLIDSIGALPEDNLRVNFARFILDLIDPGDQTKLRVAFVLGCNTFPRTLLPTHGTRVLTLEKVTLSTLKRNDSIGLIRDPLREYAGVDLPQDVVEEIHRQTGGHPYLIHSFMYDLWDTRHGGQITLDAVRARAGRLVDDLNEFAALILDQIGANSLADHLISLIYRQSDPLTLEQIHRGLPEEMKTVRHEVSGTLEELVMLGAVTMHEDSVKTYISSGEIFRQWFARAEYYTPKIAGNKGMVFLSYARADEAEVKEMYVRLQQRGLRPWMDTIDILPGEDWELAISEAIRKADCFIPCLSKRSYNKRGAIQKEIKQALDIWLEMLGNDIYLIPVRFEACDMPPRLAKFQRADLFEEGGFDKLVEAILEGIRRRSEE